MEVLELQDQDKEEWDKYVYDSPQATMYHLAGWKDVMEDTFGLRSHYLSAKEGDQILGVLPLLHIKSRLSGHFFTSMPGSVCTQDEETARALVERAKELVRASRAGYLILRDSHRKWDVPELVTNEDHCTLVLKLFDDPEQQWKSIDRRVRQHINKAISAKLEMVIGPDYLESFYPVYTQALREMGTPTQGPEFFRNALRQFPAHFTIIMVHHNGQVLGGTFAAFFRDTIYTTWAGFLRQFYELRLTHSLYWETLKYGCENGFQWIDLGRSKVDSGTYVFKTRFGAQPRPLYQQCYLNGISQPPAVGGAREDDAKYRLFVRVWRRLPLSMVEFLGPRLRKRMPFG